MLINHEGYFHVLDTIKAQIKKAQYKAILGVNREQILLFWNIGKIIAANTKYGAKFIENLARDIKAEFPDVRGYSVRNLKYMRKFASFVDDEQKVQTLSALLSWSHNTYLFDKTRTLGEYKLSDFVPQELADTLPSAEDIEKRVLSKYKITEDEKGS